MTILAVIGDCTTTTCLALAATWPLVDRPFVLEADPRGGSLAAWLDVPRQPSLSTLVARSRAADWSVIDELIQTAPSGVRVLLAPPRSVEASRVVAEAAAVMAALAAVHPPVAITDCGPTTVGAGLPLVLGQAGVVLVVHRQRAASSCAAAVRLERVAELVEALTARAMPTVLAVIGRSPFDAVDIAAFVGAETEPVRHVVLADDPLAAAVLAGRTGVSARRLARLPLLRTSAEAAASLAAHLEPVRSTSDRGTP